MTRVPEVTPAELERLAAQIDEWWVFPSRARRVQPDRVLIPVARGQPVGSNPWLVEKPPRFFDRVIALTGVRSFAIDGCVADIPDLMESIYWSPAEHVLTLELLGSDVRVQLEALRIRLERATPETAVYRRRGGPAPSERDMRRATAALGSGDERRRAKTVKRLSRMPARHGGPLLLRALDDPSDAVASGAARALGDAGHQPAVGPLLHHLERALDRPGENDLAYSCAAALADLGAARAVPALRRALRHHDLSVRFEAALALGRLGAVEAAPDLRRLLEPDLQDEDHKVLEEVLHALALLGDREALERARGHPRHEVRVEAKDQLRELK